LRGFSEKERRFLRKDTCLLGKNRGQEKAYPEWKWREHCGAKRGDLIPQINADLSQNYSTEGKR
jgi:hypothetical protein